MIKVNVGQLRSITHKASMLTQDENIVDIAFPVTQYPEKIKSHNFDKEPVVTGILEGIKGQYLIFDTGVINVRKFTSYEVEVV